jgi:hypothetical protein
VSLGLDIYDRAPPVRLVDIGDGGEPVAVHDMWPLDTLAVQLSGASVADILQIECDLRRSAAARLARRGGMRPGPAPYLRRALAMCEARRHQLAAQAAEARGDAIAVSRA